VSDSWILKSDNETNIVCDSWILKQTPQNLVSNTIIKTTYISSLLSNLYIFELGIESSIGTDSHILYAHTKNIESDLLIKKLATEFNLTSNSVILLPHEGSLVSDMQIGWPGLENNLVSDSYILTLYKDTSIGMNSHILQTYSNNIGSFLDIFKSYTENIASDSLVMIPGYEGPSRPVIKGVQYAYIKPKIKKVNKTITKPVIKRNYKEKEYLVDSY
jgi:hypothetical protein